jgi:hypothetical protein
MLLGRRVGRHRRTFPLYPPADVVLDERSERYIELENLPTPEVEERRKSFHFHPPFGGVRSVVFSSAYLILRIEG